MDRTNTTAFIEAQQYSQFILENLPDIVLPDGFTRDVSDFGTGTTLNIKTVGSTTIQDVAENIPLSFTNIDTNSITMSITDYIGDAWQVSDELRQDGSQIDTLLAMRAMEATRAIAENVETKYLAKCNSIQTANAANNVNNIKHRFVANGAGKQITLQDFAYMAYAFDKANVPDGGRIAIVDPVVELTINTLTNLVNVSNNPRFEGMITDGFAKDHRFVRNIFGWDIYTSNRLATLSAAEGALTDYEGNVTAGAVGDVANIFMSVLDDNTKPIMRAWRLMPQTEGWRDPEGRADKFQVTCRFGFGGQRTDTLGILITSPTAF